MSGFLGVKDDRTFIHEIHNPRARPINAPLFLQDLSRRCLVSFIFKMATTRMDFLNGSVLVKVKRLCLHESDLTINAKIQNKRFITSSFVHEHRNRAGISKRSRDVIEIHRYVLLSSAAELLRQRRIAVNAFGSSLKR